jgi:hypothetical protein
MKFFEHITPMQKGIAALILGGFLFLHATGMLVISSFFIVIIALVLIGYGLYATGLLPKIVRMVKKK